MFKSRESLEKLQKDVREGKIRPDDMRNIIFEERTKNMFTNKVIKKIEEAIGFKLYPWQKSFLEKEFELNHKYRCVGNSTIFAIKKLLTINDRFSIESSRVAELFDYVPLGFQMDRNFIEGINKKLLSAGFDTCLNIMEVPWFEMRIDSVIGEPKIKVTGKEFDTKGQEYIKLDSGQIIILNSDASEWFENIVEKNMVEVRIDSPLFKSKESCHLKRYKFPWNLV